MEDHTSKTIPVAIPETAFEVCRKLVVKNRMDDDPNWYERQSVTLFCKTRTVQLQPLFRLAHFPCARLY
jgi:hypothetical protein